MKKILLLFVMALYVSSCTQDLTQNENMQPQSDETTAPVKSGVLHFNSVDDLSSTISQMKERQAFDIKHLPATRAAAQRRVRFAPPALARSRSSRVYGCRIG